MSNVGWVTVSSLLTTKANRTQPRSSEKRKRAPFLAQFRLLAGRRTGNSPPLSCFACFRTTAICLVVPSIGTVALQGKWYSLRQVLE